MLSALNPWRGLRGLPADVWIIFVTSLINRAGVMALPFLVLYLTAFLHVSATLAGLALTTYGIGGMVTAPIAGRLCDRYGPFAVMRVALALTGLILLLIPLAHDFRVVLAMTFCWAVAADAVRPATLSGLVEQVAPERRKAAVALNRLAVNLGMSIGPAVGGFIAKLSFPTLFVVDGATSLAAAVVLSILLAARTPAAPMLGGRGPARAARAGADEPAGARASVWRDSRMLLFLSGVLLVSIVFMQNQGALPLYVVRDLHYQTTFYGMLFVVNTLIIAMVEVPLNLAMARWSHRGSLLLGALLTAVGFGAVGVARVPPALAATVAVWTFGEMIFFPASTAYVADVAPPGRSGEYMGAYASMFALAQIIGPWSGTAVLDRFGPTVMWGAVFAFGVIAAGVIGAARPEATRVVLSVD